MATKIGITSRHITTFPLTGYVFGGPIPGFDTRSRILPGAWTNIEQDFARHPPIHIVDVQADPVGISTLQRADRWIDAPLFFILICES